MSRPETCAVCGETVLWGTRDGVGPRWLHREEVDHKAMFGVLSSQASPVRLPQTETEAKVEKVFDLPEPEQRATPITVDDLPPRSGMRKVWNYIAKAEGWEEAVLTKARGPYMGADGHLLSVSDSVKLVARGEVRLDGGVPLVVASWRDGKFDFAYGGAAYAGSISPTRMNATDLKDWIQTQ